MQFIKPICRVERRAPSMDWHWHWHEAKKRRPTDQVKSCFALRVEIHEQTRGENRV
jgi:hypothetical protein